MRNKIIKLDIGTFGGSPAAHTLAQITEELENNSSGNNKRILTGVGGYIHSTGKMLNRMDKCITDDSIFYMTVEWMMHQKYKDINESSLPPIVKSLLCNVCCANKRDKIKARKDRNKK